MIRYFMAFEGVYSIIPTAFTESGDIDEASQRRVVDLFIDKGANGLTALGVTGEVARLEEHERAKVLEIVVKQANGRVPIIAGTSAEGTRTCISYTRQAKDLGAAAVMVSPPRMAKLNSDAVVRHYNQDIIPGKKRTRENYFSFRNSLFLFYRFGCWNQKRLLYTFLLNRFIYGKYTIKSRILYAFAFVDHIRYIPYLLRTRDLWCANSHPWVRLEETSLAD